MILSRGYIIGAILGRAAAGDKDFHTPYRCKHPNLSSVQLFRRIFIIFSDVWLVALSFLTGRGCFRADSVLRMLKSTNVLCP